MTSFQYVDITGIPEGSTGVSGGTVTLDEAKQGSTYSNRGGWDFATIWYIDEGVGYPKLKAHKIE